MADAMQLWTYHPDTFQIDAPDLCIDPTLGRNWTYESRGFRYREVFPIFCRYIGVPDGQFLWCKCERGWENFSGKIVEWELNIPAHALRFYRGDVWEALVWSKSDDWSRLIVDASARNVEAVALTPLQAGWATRHGPLPKRRKARRFNV